MHSEFRRNSVLVGQAGTSTALAYAGGTGLVVALVRELRHVLGGAIPAKVSAEALDAVQGLIRVELDPESSGKAAAAAVVEEFDARGCRDVKRSLARLGLAPGAPIPAPPRPHLRLHASGPASSRRLRRDGVDGLERVLRIIERLHLTSLTFADRAGGAGCDGFYDLDLWALAGSETELGALEARARAVVRSEPGTSVSVHRLRNPGGDAGVGGTGPYPVEPWAPGARADDCPAALCDVV